VTGDWLGRIDRWIAYANSIVEEGSQERRPAHRISQPGVGGVRRRDIFRGAARRRLGLSGASSLTQQVT